MSSLDASDERWHPPRPLAYAGHMFRPYQMTMAPQMVATQQAQAQRLAQDTAVNLPESVRDGGDPARASRLQGLCEGLLGNLATEASFEQQIGELRLASGNVTQFRQALFMLMKMHDVAGPVRNVLMERAMAWFRARAQVERQGAQPWAKSFVQVAENYAGKW